jgi:hypothetical protein
VWSVFEPEQANSLLVVCEGFKKRGGIVGTIGGLGFPRICASISVGKVSRRYTHKEDEDLRASVAKLPSISTYPAKMQKRKSIK